MEKKLVQKKIDLSNQRGFTLWDPSAAKLGGSLHCGPLSIDLDRTPSTHTSAPTWQKP